MFFIFISIIFNAKAQNIIKYKDNFKRVQIREIIKQESPRTVDKKESKVEVDSLNNFVVLKKQFDELEKSKMKLLSKASKKTKTNKLNFTLPLDSFKINSDYGMRKHPITKLYTKHKGIDLKAKYEHVKAFMDGKIIKKGYSSTKGNYIHILSGKIETRYFHLSKILVSKGDKVVNGQIVAFSGNTGRSTAPHLHFETLLNKKHINPIKLIAILKKLNTDAEFTR